MSLEEIKKHLLDRRLPIVAEKTGIHENTLRAIRDNEDANPKWSTIKTLSDYFGAAND